MKKISIVLISLLSSLIMGQKEIPGSGSASGTLLDERTNGNQDLVIDPEMVQEVRMLKVNKEKMLSSANLGFICATDLADWLVMELDIPFREAHDISGRAVKFAEQNDCSLNELPLDLYQKIDKRINKNVYSVLSIENSVKNKLSYGGTAPKEVLKQIKNAKKRFLGWKMKKYLYKILIFNFSLLLLFGTVACGKKSMPIPEDQISSDVS